VEQERHEAARLERHEEEVMKTPAQRKADERKRHADAGRVPRTHYIHPDDSAKLAKYVARLNKVRNHGPQ
jgi:hypothetical protein